MTSVLIFPIVLAGMLTQSITGFGFALVAMPLLIHLLGVQTASPLGALLAITGQVYLVLHHRESFNPKAIAPLVAGALVGIPIGVLALQRVESSTLLAALGVVIIGYALYALLELRLPAIKHPAWALGFGFISGILTGAFNTGGPPIVIYATCKGWSQAEFKGNLQGTFMCFSIVTLLTHALNQHFTAFIVHSYLVAVPAVALGLWLGLKIDRRLNPALFRKVVLVTLLAIGLSLIV